MSKISSILAANQGLIAGVCVFAAGAVGVGGYMGLLSTETPQTPDVIEVAQPAETVVVEDVPAVAPKVVPEPAPSVAAPEAPPAEVVLNAPTIDEVRNEPDGLTIIAGRAEPGSDVILFVDNVENMTVQAGGDGAFAAVTFLTPNGSAQVLRIVQRVDGFEDLAADDIILAPRTVVVAEVVPEPVIEAAPVPQEIAQASEEEPSEPTAQAEPVVPAAPADTASVTPEPSEPAAPQTTAQEVATAAPQSAPIPEVAELPDSAAPTPEVATQEAVAEPQSPAAAEPVEVATGPTPQAPASQEVAAVEPVQPVVDAEPAAEPAAPVQEVAVIKSDQTGVEIINRSSAPDVMSNVAIDTISYSEQGDVLLSGRAQSQAKAVRVYLDNAVITTLDVDTSGRWRGDLPDVDTGIYTLRVDEVSADGAVTSRAETPFKREAPEALTVALDDGSDAPVKAVTVQTGATLWAIARERYGSGTLYVRVLEANKDSIRDPDLIYPGQVFDLPVE